MIRFVCDEDFNGRIVRALLLRKRDLDLVRIQDVGLRSADDDVILEWASTNRRLLLTHDARSMPKHVRRHLAAGSHLPGVFVVDNLESIGDCVEDILLVAECSDDADWDDLVTYLPFRRV